MVKLNKIYTKTGDDGTTGLVDGSRISKDDPRMAAIGDVDELNSAIGVAICEISDETLVAVLRVIQNDLFDLGADLATPAAEGDDFAPSEMVLRVTASQVARLEHQIDEVNGALDPLTSFILPGGNKAAAAIHVVRAIARRAERTAVSAAQSMAINAHALAYINRLSDYLFVLGRALNNSGKADILWVPGASR
ncbi:cob(I)yrinic acid a,c-diamide adenosyltransferase [Parasphingorhabdus halotolerans]|uniref:Corrinoid adenosyltransferase n=1 Tax=Parasphingorhabdus halotolerans TaxID=2725558 RepID=A0A6H2DP12_9SPHN|nr:cob(I)yrinic acid a,c-diamide adenosyltransferase [Parasphingorhabdus halotolerans]QJB70402.1 cob(I)yrinic acid a,c-diamide adenosyltransferase [Parasphingorhabdus halotolerans]